MSTQTVDQTDERQEWEDRLRDFLAGDPLPEPPRAKTSDIVKRVP